MNKSNPVLILIRRIEYNRYLSSGLSANYYGESAADSVVFLLDSIRSFTVDSPYNSTKMVTLTYLTPPKLFP